MIKNPNTYALVHGAWHGAWCWDFVSEHLEAAGQQALAMDLPIDLPNKNFDDYSDVVVATLMESQKNENLVLVGHSRGSNVIPRVAAKLAVKQIIYLCAAFEPATIGRPTQEDESEMPTRYSQAFTNGIEYLGNDMTSFNHEVAKQVFYDDCSEEIAEWAVGKLRLQKRSQNEPILPEWPDIQQTSIICTDDQVLNPNWSRYVSKKWLNALVIEMPGGHSPFLSRPKELADLILSISL